MKYPSKQVVVSVHNHVATIRFNNPKRYNAWGPVLMGEMKESLAMAAEDKAVKAAVLTGTGDYYCSGVDFAGSFSIMKPSAFKKKLAAQNSDLFERYIAFPKPLITAVNGPAIGACVTSAVLADRIVASPRATFHTPFHSLGIVPEGCSSVTFAERMGEAGAARMLGEEGWKPTAEEALEVGLIHEVAAADDLQPRAQAIAEDLIAANYVRPVVADPARAAFLRRVNDEESVALAEAFLSTAFLKNQEQFFAKKKKAQMAAMFKILRMTRPLWKNI